MPDRASKQVSRLGHEFGSRLYENGAPRYRLGGTVQYIGTLHWSQDQRLKPARHRAAARRIRNIASIISDIQSTSLGEKVEIYQFSQGRCPNGTHHAMNDRITLAAPPLRPTEVYVLWKIVLGLPYNVRHHYMWKVV